MNLEFARRFVRPSYSSWDILVMLLVYSVLKRVFPDVKEWSDLTLWSGVGSFVLAFAIAIPTMYIGVRGEQKWWSITPRYEDA